MKGRGATNGLEQEPNEEKVGKDHTERAANDRLEDASSLYELYVGRLVGASHGLYEAWTNGTHSAFNVHIQGI
jgi:hypothetical protein